MIGRGGRRAASGRGVSEVIGVVLLVAIVVILAGTVAYALTGVDRGREPAPQFSKLDEYDRQTSGDGQELEIEHGSGEVVETRDMRLVVEGAVVRDASDAYVAQAELDVSLTDQVGDEWNVGERLRVNSSTMQHDDGTDIGPNEHLDLGGASVRIVWVPRNEGSSDTLYRWKGPDA